MITAHEGLNAGEIVLLWSEASWEEACVVLTMPDTQQLVPEGYSIVKASLNRPRKEDGRSKGRRTNVTFVLAHTNHSHPPASIEAVRKRWEKELAP